MKRILVANRGEIAVRVIRACHELGLEAVAVYSTADREGAWVSLADRSVCIGPPAARDSYLNQTNVIAAAETTGCDALHPGYGFLSESPSFVRTCEENDLIFIGPTAESMEVLGDKSLAKGAMRAAGMPLVPGSEGRLSGVDEARKVAGEVGYPVLLKAASGGGGRGMRPVGEPSELEAAYATATAEAEAAFSDGGLYLEKIVVDAHHVEVQVVGDGEGGALVVGERECSVQRRHQKLLEESPSPFLSEMARRELYDAALGAVRATNYRNAGTIECLLGGDQSFYFMEMNTRLQVEHPVSEEVTGIDLVRTQLRLAMGEPLPPAGHLADARARDRVPHQRRGSVARVHALARAAAPLPPAARPRRARRHARLRGLHGAAHVRLARGEADRVRSRSHLRAGASRAGARGVRGRGHLDDDPALPRDGHRPRLPLG